ncbi:hypothetical protein D3C87_1973530 [compost metagenome]
MPWLQDQAVLLQEIEKIFLRQIENLLPLKSVEFGFFLIRAFRGARQRAPQIAVGLFLVFQPFARPLLLLLRG